MKNLNKIVLAATVLVLATGAAVYVGLPSQSPEATDGAVPGAWMHRVIVVAAGALPASETVRARLCGASSSCRNGEDNTDVAVLESGEMPARAMTAVVETDENCAPDMYGISHCTNRLRLADGRTIEVRHDHNMHRFPCLRPGETVRIEMQQSV